MQVQDIVRDPARHSIVLTARSYIKLQLNLRQSKRDIVPGQEPAYSSRRVLSGSILLALRAGR